VHSIVQVSGSRADARARTGDAFITRDDLLHRVRVAQHEERLTASLGAEHVLDIPRRFFSNVSVHHYDCS
jgi:hypothetical protein